MRTPDWKMCLLATAIAALSACNDDNNNNPPPPAPAPVTPGNVTALTVANKLISFNRDAPGTIITSVQISGLQSGENLLGIDVRPVDGMLYGVSNLGRIYTLSTATGAATLKSTLAAAAGDDNPFVALSGTDFGVDFNPAADRLRVNSDTGQNLRINVDSGATTTDGAINGGAANTMITAAAYTNSVAGTGATTLFDIDSATDTLFSQNPPNNGTLATPVTLGVDATGVNAFDIDGRSNAGFAALTVGGVTGFYRINVAAASNAATLVGSVGGGEQLRGIALAATPAATVVALTTDSRLLSFAPASPTTITATTAITGLPNGESLLGIDFRPADGMLYGVTNAGRVYTIDPTTGAAAIKSTLIADAADTTNAFNGIAGTLFAVDFNPVADRLRVISETGQNLRINVDTGATTTDGAINRGAAAPMVTAAAYSNSFAGTTATTLFDLDLASGNLTMQVPPNDGTLIDVGPLGVAATGDAAADIAGGANGIALAALRTGAAGPYSLYRINLTTGAATLINGATDPTLSLIGGTSGPALRDVAIKL